MIHQAKKRILAAALTLVLILTQTALYAQAETGEPEGNPSDGGDYVSTITDPDEPEQSDTDGPGDHVPADEPGGNGPANRAPTATPTTLGYSSIVAFAPLPEDVAEQEVTTGTQFADLDLPDALAATVEDEEGDQIDADIPVEGWRAAPEYDPQEMGAYTFTPELAAGYTLADGVELPEITVRVVMGIMPLATVVDSGTCGAGVTWALENDAGNYILTISGSGDMANYTYMGAAPWYNYRSDVTAIIIENGVTSIGRYTFTSCGFTSIDIPNSVTSIGESAFMDCNSITSINIPDNVTSMGELAFYGCEGLESVTIGNGVTSIGFQVFAVCEILESVTIGNSVNRIGNQAFYGCTSLESVTIPDSVDSIGTSAFENCTSLESVIIGNNVTSIGNQAFSGCTSLESVTIGNSVTSIGDYTFYGCTSLESIDIPDSVTSIGTSAFQGCASLESVTIPDSVTSIGYSTFRNCTSLASITIPDKVTSIYNYTFYGCTSLESVTIGNSVTDIGFRVFWNCTSLESIIIPDSVTSIDGFAFQDCTSLESVTFQGTTPPTILADAFDDVSATGTVYCPEGASGYDTTWLSGITGLSGWTLVADTLHSITIQSSTGGTVSADKTQARAYETVILTVSPDTGYYVADWNPTPSGLPITENYDGTYTFTMPGENVTLSPEFREYLSVTYDANGGTGGLVVGNIESGTTHVVFTLDQLNVSRVGHFFQEWNTAADGNGDLYMPGDILLIDDNLTLYAVWEYDGATTVNLTYDANGGSGGPNIETGTIPGHTRTAPAPDAIGITPSGSVIFTGWNTLPGGTGDSYDPGDTVKVDDDMTLYAIWEPIFTITASADANGSIAPSGYVTVADGGSQTFTITPDTGYEIADVEVDGGSVGAVSSYTFTGVAADHTIHATFKQVIVPTVNAQTPVIGTQPVGGTFQQNAPATLTVTASVSDGGTLSYQWYSNTSNSNAGGAAISGATNSSYSPSTAQTGTGHYYVVVTNTNDSVNGNKTAATASNPVTVTVTGGSDNGGGNGGGNGGNSGNNSGGSSSGRSSSGGSSTPDNRVAKTQLPAPAFSWDGGRTLTINHDSITALGLLSVQWNGKTLTPGTDFTSHQGSVIIRFSEEFIAAQATGNHTVRVEFLNYTGEYTLTLDGTGAGTVENGEAGGGTVSGNDTHNPQTGDFDLSPWWWLIALIPAAAITLVSASLIWQRLRGQREVA